MSEPSAVETVEIMLDKKRHLNLDHMALFRAECEVNKIRGAPPDNKIGIDYLIISSYAARASLLPLDLLLSLLHQGLIDEDPKVTFEDCAAMVAQSPLTRSEISVLLWNAYYITAGKNLKVRTAEHDDGGDEEKKTADLGTGSGNGVLQ